MDGLAHLRREAPVHALMLGVMAVAMLSHSAFAALAGAGVLLGVALPCAALSRSRTFLRAHVVDLWAMALVLLATLPGHPSRHHAVTIPGGWAFAAIVATWAGARVWLGMRGERGARPVAVASGALTAAGLVVMALV